MKLQLWNNRVNSLCYVENWKSIISEMFWVVLMVFGSQIQKKKANFQIQILFIRVELFTEWPVWGAEGVLTANMCFCWNVFANVNNLCLPVAPNAVTRGLHDPWRMLPSQRLIHENLQLIFLCLNVSHEIKEKGTLFIRLAVGKLQHLINKNGREKIQYKFGEWTEKKNEWFPPPFMLLEHEPRTLHVLGECGTT